MPTAVMAASAIVADHARDAARIARAEQHRDEQEERRLQQRQRERADEPPEHEAGAVHGRGQQPVEEAELDVGGHRDPGRQPREDRALDDRARARRTPGRTRRRGSPAGPGRRSCRWRSPPAASSGSTNVGISSCARRNCTLSARRPSAAHHAALLRHGAHDAGAIAAAPSRCEPVTATNTSSSVGVSTSTNSTSTPASSSARTTGAIAACPGRRAHADARRRALARRLDPAERRPAPRTRAPRPRGRSSRRARSAPPRAPSATPACPRRRGCRAR